MYGAPPSGGQEKSPERAASAADPALAAALRIQRRRHRWAVAMVWFSAAFLFLYFTASDASQNGTPAPAWYIDLMWVAAAAALVTIGVVIGYRVTMSRQPAPARAQAILLEKQRFQRRWRRGGWPRRIFFFFWDLAESLGFALFLGAAILGVTWAINGAAYLFGAGIAVHWGTPPIRSDGDAAVSLIIGLLFIFGGVLVVYTLYRNLKKRWLRHLQRKAEAGAISWPPST
jgi:TRAP-type mannitol/chloroaromatic compound transport system permease small subunit